MTPRLKRLLIVLLCTAGLGLLALRWEKRRPELQLWEKPILIQPSGKIWLFETSEKGDGFTRREFDSASHESTELVNWIDGKTGWAFDNSTQDPYHGTSVVADVYSVKIEMAKISLHYARERGADDDSLITVSRPLSADERSELLTIIHEIDQDYPRSENVQFSEYGKLPKNSGNQ